jgi:membrane protein YdbS with pleckstrin-like domain
MTGEEFDDQEIADIAEVYDALKKDAKNLISDLQAGVRMWVRNSVALIVMAVSAVNIAWYATPNPSWSNPWFVVPATLFIMIGAALAIYYYTHARFLRRKYARLFEAAKKLK